jgi:hypothetical protein
MTPLGSPGGGDENSICLTNRHLATDAIDERWKKGQARNGTAFA